MTYTHTLQGPNKYFEDLNEKFLRLEHLKFLKIDDDNDKKTIAEHAFEQAVPPIAMNEINASKRLKEAAFEKAEGVIYQCANKTL